MKNVSPLIKTRLLIGAMLFTLIISISAIGQVNAQTAVVSIKPGEVTVPQPGQTFTVDLNITDVTNMYAYEVKIWFRNDVLQAIQAVRPSGHFMEPSDPTGQFVAKWEIKNDFNATHGRIWLSLTLLSPETAKTGSGILARITFNGTNVGSTPLTLNNYPGALGPVKLADNTAQPIAHTAEDGSVNVVPEFSIGMIFVLLMMSLILIAVSKMTRSKTYSYQKQT